MQMYYVKAYDKSINPLPLFKFLIKRFVSLDLTHLKMIIYSRDVIDAPLYVTTINQLILSIHMSAIVI